MFMNSEVRFPTMRYVPETNQPVQIKAFASRLNVLRVLQIKAFASCLNVIRVLSYRSNIIWSFIA